MDEEKKEESEEILVPSDPMDEMLCEGCQ